MFNVLPAAQLFRRLTGACVLQLPIITRYYVTLSFLTTAACALEVSSAHWFHTKQMYAVFNVPVCESVQGGWRTMLQLDAVHRRRVAGTATSHACAATQIITPFNVYFNSHLIFKKGEIWRLLTNFFFFGNLGEPLLPFTCSAQYTAQPVSPQSLGITVDTDGQKRGTAAAAAAGQQQGFAATKQRRHTQAGTRLHVSRHICTAVTWLTYLLQ
jgi:hypothetical protein